MIILKIKLNSIIKFLNNWFYPIMGILLTFTPTLTVCPWTEEKGYMICWIVALFSMILVSILIFTGIINNYNRRNKLIELNHVIAILIGVASILAPLKWIGGCMNLQMRCHTVGYPTLYTIAGIILSYTLGKIILNFNVVKKVENKISIAEKSR